MKPQKMDPKMDQQKNRGMKEDKDQDFPAEKRGERPTSQGRDQDRAPSPGKSQDYKGRSGEPETIGNKSQYQTDKTSHGNDEVGAPREAGGKKTKGRTV